MKFFEIIDKLEIIRNKYNADRSISSNKFKAVAYNNTIQKIKNRFPLNKKISIKLIENLDISTRMKSHIYDIINNDDSCKDNIDIIKKVRFGKDENKDDFKQSINTLINKLIKIPGIGLSKANILVKNGLTNINQLYSKKYIDQVSNETKIFLKQIPIKKIPYTSIKKIEPLLKSFKNTTIVGSFRRKAPFSTDIDIMIIDDMDKSDQNNDILNDFLIFLKTKLNESCVHVYSKGNSKMSLIVDFSTYLKTPGQKYKLDIFKTLPEYKATMLLYSTGSKKHNIDMRLKAKKLNMLLNRYGLFLNNVKVNTINEKSIFDLLNIKYVPPERR